MATTNPEGEGASAAASDVARSFPPLEGERATVLILGSMPGLASLDARRYYAHPRNAFWPIALALLDGHSREDGRAGADGVDPPATGDGSADGGAVSGATSPVGGPARRDVAERLPPYDERVARLVAGGIALWDVLAECERPGSLDSAIRRASERPNNIPALVARHPELALVAFNGQTAAKLFERHAGETVRAARPGLAFATLPSTSPAYASLSLADKLARWHVALRSALDLGTDRHRSLDNEARR